MLTQKQHEIRRNGIGASDCAAAMGISPWKTKLELYLEKIGIIEKQETKFGTQMYWGNVLEPSVAQAYEDYTGKKLRKSLMTLRHKDHDFIICHLDRKIEGERKILECKTSSFFNANEKWGENGSVDAPLYYIAQVQHQMAITGYDEADIAVLIGGYDFRCYTIKKDNEIIEKIIESHCDFWYNHVLKQIPPEPTNKADIELLYARDTGIPIDATDEVASCIDDMIELKSQAKLNDKLQKEMQDKIALFMKDASSLQYYGKELLTWKADKNGKRTMRIK
jgi:putative phage-type endonuclease